MNRRRLSALAMLATFAVIATGCSVTEDGQDLALGPPPLELAYTDGELRIGLVLQSATRAFSKSLSTGAQEAARDAGAHLTVVAADGSHDAQLERADELIRDGIDALILSPVDSVQAPAIADTARAAGVPLLAVSNQIGSVEEFGAQYVYPGTVGLIANDDLQMGRIAAGFVQGPVGANIAVLEGHPAAANSNLRLAGFTAALDSLGVDYEVVSKLTGYWDKQTAQPACEAFAAIGTIDLVFSMSDEMTTGCITQFALAGLTDVQFITIGGSSRSRSLLSFDTLIGAVCQAPRDLGSLAVNTLIDAYETGKHDQGLKIGVASELTKDSEASIESCSAGW